MFDRCASFFFGMKILSEGPYLKFFISRVRTKHRERFSSFRVSVIRLPVATYFLSSLPCDDSTKAVNFNKQDVANLLQLWILLKKYRRDNPQLWTIEI